MSQRLIAVVAVAALAACGGTSSSPSDAAADAGAPHDGAAAGDTAADGDGPTAADAPPASDGGAPGCDGGPTWTTLQHLTPLELHDLLAASDPILINVHTPWAGDIPGTDADIVYTDVDGIEAFVAYDHCASIVLYCLTGPMSVSAGNALIARGYLRVSDLLGGLNAWEAAGYPVNH